MIALRQLFQHLATGASLTGDDIVALLLLMTMIVSSGHIITMLATRWGERHIRVKSLAASVLVHSVCFLGLEVFEPLKPLSAQTETPPPELPPETVQTQILVESDREILLRDAGNTPIADRPVQPDIPLERLESPTPEISEPIVPEPDLPSPQELQTSAEDVTQFDEKEITEVASESEAGAEGTIQPAASDPAADLKTMQEPSRADIYTPENFRTIPEPGRRDRSQRTDEAPSMPAAKAPELTLSEPTPARQPDLALDSSSTIQIPRNAFEEAPEIQRVTAPTVAPEITEGGLLEPDRVRNRRGPSTSFQSRIPRRSRSTSEDSSAVRPSKSPLQQPATPTPVTQDYDDVRIGTDNSADFADAVISGAKLEEADLPAVRRRDTPPPTYLLRQVEKRRDAVTRFGGTKQSEEAVERSLRWLSNAQSADGRWDASKYGSGQVRIDEKGVDRKFAGREADTGLTALSALAFLGAGYTHEGGKYALVVDHALDWMISSQGEDGNLSGNAEHFAKMYCHAMATYALAEAWGMQKETVLGPIIDAAELGESLAVTHQATATVMAVGLCQPQIGFTPMTEIALISSDQLAESLRKVSESRLREALAKAVTFTISRQDPQSGGWRYKPGQEGDVSMFGWQMMSLKSAEIAGVEIEDGVRDRMDGFLKKVRQGKHGGLFGYRRNTRTGNRDSEPPTPVMTAEALFCQQMLGYPRSSDSSRESVNFILNHMPRESETNYYYWYYGTLAMYQYGGPEWERWNGVVRDTLISQQRTDRSELDGSWDPVDPWGRYGGRLYSTALATLTLEVYYRLLPLYRMNIPTDRPGNK
ncbi:MAG: hypothetical protein ACK526_17310 [Planctomyces sp.]|jgi:hypothetical protein